MLQILFPVADWTKTNAALPFLSHLPICALEKGPWSPAACIHMALYHAEQYLLHAMLSFKT